jgi:hypothetical protein
LKYFSRLFFLSILFHSSFSFAQSFHGNIQSLSPAMQKQMLNNSWHSRCPVPLHQLRAVTVTYWGFDQQTHQGILIVNQRVAQQVLDIFHDLFSNHFVIAKINPMDKYNGDDDLAMADDNTSAFNCRTMRNTTNTFSLHSYGMAIDINPLFNPYVRGSDIAPPQGKKYLNRNSVVPGMIVKDDAAYQAFISRGWSWGGNWKHSKDYSHFEKH